MAILTDSEGQLINIHDAQLLCWVLIRFIATIIRVRFRVRVRVRVSDIRVSDIRVKSQRRVRAKLLNSETPYF